MASALAVVVGQPSLWLLGALGFVLRGGIVLLLASVVILPTPVELRMLLGTNLGSSGFAPDFMALLAFGAVLVGLLVLLALAIVAYAELAAFERLVRDPETSDQRAGRSPLPIVGRRRSALLAGLFLLQLAALAFLALAALPLLSALVQVAYSEVVRPSLGGTIYVRVLNGVREPLLFLLGVLVVVEMVSSVASRRLLVHAFGLGRRPQPRRPLQLLTTLPACIAVGLARPLLRPVQTLLSTLLVWTVSLAVLLPAGWGIATGWSAVRGTYLSRGAADDPQAFLGLALVTLAFAALWAVGLLLAGFASALRAALWTVHELG